jgi:hypothetical protein
MIIKYDIKETDKELVLKAYKSEKNSVDNNEWFEKYRRPHL